MHSARFLFLYYKDKDKDKISHLVTGVYMDLILPGLINHLMNFLRIIVLRLNVTVPLITLVNVQRARKAKFEGWLTSKVVNKFAPECQTRTSKSTWKFFE